MLDEDINIVMGRGDVRLNHKRVQVKKKKPCPEFILIYYAIRQPAVLKKQSKIYVPAC